MIPELIEYFKLLLNALRHYYRVPQKLISSLGVNIGRKSELDDEMADNNNREGISIELPARIEHSGNVLDALSCDIRTLARQTELMWEHATEIECLAADCSALVTRDGVLRAKVSSIAKHAECLQSHVMEQAKSFHQCGLELDDARRQGLFNVRSNVEDSEEYKVFQETNEAIASTFKDVKNLLLEQSKLIAEVKGQPKIDLAINETIDLESEGENLAKLSASKEEEEVGDKNETYLLAKRNGFLEKHKLVLDKFKEQKNVTYYRSF